MRLLMGRIWMKKKKRVNLKEANLGQNVKDLFWMMKVEEVLNVWRKRRYEIVIWEGIECRRKKDLKP